MRPIKNPDNFQSKKYGWWTLELQAGTAEALLPVGVPKARRHTKCANTGVWTSQKTCCSSLLEAICWQHCLHVPWEQVTKQEFCSSLADASDTRDPLFSSDFRLRPSNGARGSSRSWGLYIPRWWWSAPRTPRSGISSKGPLFVPSDAGFTYWIGSIFQRHETEQGSSFQNWETKYYMQYYSPQKDRLAEAIHVSTYWPVQGSAEWPQVRREAQEERLETFSQTSREM